MRPNHIWYNALLAIEYHKMSFCHEINHDRITSFHGIHVLIIIKSDLLFITDQLISDLVRWFITLLYYFDSK